MGSFEKSIKRKQLLEKRKRMKKGLKHVLNATLGMPTSCTLCNKPFSKEEDPAKWYCSVRANKVVLVCPSCHPGQT